MRRRIPVPAAAALLAAITAPPAVAATPATRNPYRTAAERLFVDLEYEETLRTLAKAEAWPSNTPEDEVAIALFQGVVLADMNREGEALRSFKRGLAIEPAAVLAVRVSPKVAALFQQARRELRIPDSPTPSSPSPPPAPPSPPSPPVARATEPAPTVAGIRWFAGVWGLGDVAGRSVGAGASAGVDFGGLELSARVAAGAAVGLGVQAAYRFGDGTVAPVAGLRGTVFPGPAAVGGGPLAGVRVAIGRGLYLTLDTSGEFFAAPPPNLSVAWLVTAGVAFSPGGAR